MSQSTDGQICYGVVFPEGFEFPWDADDETGIESWWRTVNGYKKPFELYAEDDDTEPPESKIDEFYEHQDKWDEANPIPVELVNYCTGDCPMYIIATKDSVKTNSRGYPEEFIPSELKTTEEKTLINFIEKHLMESINKHNNDEYNDTPIEIKPKWYLSSFWG